MRAAVQVLKSTGKKAIAVRDADVGQAPNDGLLSFPGQRPPEVEVFSHPSIKSLIHDKYGIDVDWILSRDAVNDHHKISHHIACEAEAEEEVIRTLAIERYVSEISHEFDSLIKEVSLELS